MKYDKTKYSVSWVDGVMVITDLQPITENSPMPPPPSLTYNKDTGEVELK